MKIGSTFADVIIKIKAVYFLRHGVHLLDPTRSDMTSLTVP